MSLDTQSTFAAALMDTEQSVPHGLAAWNGPRPDRRFGVYRNNVAVGLIGALESRFPVAQKIVGEEFFAGMAHAFVQLHPPRSPLLLAYGDAFPDFVEGFEPAQAITYLPDVMRLEVARGHAYHAADADPLDAAKLVALDPERLADVKFMPHPSSVILKSEHPVVTIWAMNSGDIPLMPIEDWHGEDALVVRPAMVVEIHRLPPGGATFLTTLGQGATLMAAAEAAMRDVEDFDISANLTGALQTGAFISIR